MRKDDFYVSTTDSNFMGYILVSSFLIVMIAAYYIPQFAVAQTSERDSCNEEICHVEITKDGFVPKTLIVKEGSTVIWTNTDDRRHTVTSGSPEEITSPLKSLLLDKGDAYEFTFEFAGFYRGSYKYFDQVTRTMRGEIIVEPAPTEKIEEKIPVVQAMPIDFSNPNSGIRNVSLPNGVIKSIGILPNSTRLIISLENEVPTVMKISFDRNLLDAKNNGKDDRFMVLINGKEGFYDEISATSKERTLQIVVPINAMQIEIEGTVSYTMRAMTAISEVEELIAEHKNRGVVVRDAENKLKEAREAFDHGEYADAEILASNAKTIATNASNAALIASKALDVAKRAIDESDNQGFDVSSARQLFHLAEQEYANGNYDKVLNLAQQAKTVALELRNSGTDLPKQTDANNTTAGMFDQAYVIASVIGASATAGGAAAYTRFRKRGMNGREGSVMLSELIGAKRLIDLNKIFAERPYLRDDDKETIKYIAEKGGAVFETEIRERFNLPKTTEWRLVRRLARENIVEVKKTGGQNLIRIRDEFVNTGQNSL